MPNKTIYISDEDLIVFEKARELSNDNLSAVIIDELRHYIDMAEHKSKGYEEIVLNVKKLGILHRKKFIGRKLAWDSTTEGNFALLKNIQTVYETAKGKFVLYIAIFPDWRDLFGVQNLEAITPEMMKSHKLSDYSHFTEKMEYKMEIYDDLEALKKVISKKLADEVVNALKPKDVEFLDI